MLLRYAQKASSNPSCIPANYQSVPARMGLLGARAAVPVQDSMQPCTLECEHDRVEDTGYACVLLHNCLVTA